MLRRIPISPAAVLPPSFPRRRFFQLRRLLGRKTRGNCEASMFLVLRRAEIFVVRSKTELESATE